MLLLRNARTTHTHDEVLHHVAHHATRYDVTPVAHRFFVENPRDHHDIRYDFGSLVPSDGDTYFEFDLPSYVRLGQRLLLDQSGVRTAGVLVQRYAREDLAGIAYLVCAPLLGTAACSREGNPNPQRHLLARALTVRAHPKVQHVGTQTSVSSIA